MNNEEQQSSPGLAELSAQQLREAISSRLQGNPSVGPPSDPRVGPEPFEWLSEQFQRADAGLQHRMTAVLRDFLDELTDTERWPERARYALLDLIQDCGETLVDDAFRLIRQQTLLDAQGLGGDAHAGLLKCLISNGHHATPEFWVEQSELLGPAYGALIFSGLVDHGLELAMRHLPRLSSDPQARQQIRWLFPHLKDTCGTQTVLDALEGQRQHFPDETHRLYREDLDVSLAAGETLVADSERTHGRARQPAAKHHAMMSPKAPPTAPHTLPGLEDLVQRAKQRTRSDPREFPGVFG